MTAAVVLSASDPVTLYPAPADGPVSVVVKLVRADDGRAWSYVTVTCLPGAAWWSVPNARTLRRMVDSEAAAHGFTRAGTRTEHTDGPVTVWRFTYELEAVTSS